MLASSRDKGALIRRYWPLIAPIVVVTFVALSSGFGASSLQQTMALMLVDMILVIGLYTFVGNSGVLSFGHVGFMAIGAYSSALLTIPVATKHAQLPDLPGFLAQLELTAVPAALLGGVIAAMIAGLVGMVLMRLSGLPASIATFAFLLVVYTVIAHWRALTAGPSVLGGMPLDTDVPSALVWLIVVIAISFAFQSSSAGRRLRASREDAVAARASGVRVTRERVMAFTVSAFMVAVGGALYGHLLGSFDPNAFYLQTTFLLVVMLVFGGVNSLAGAVLGTMAVSALLEMLRQLEPGFRVGTLTFPAVTNLSELGLGVLLVAVLTFRQGGLTNNREFIFPQRGPKGAAWHTRLLGHPQYWPMRSQSTTRVAAGVAAIGVTSSSSLELDARLVAKDIAVHFGGVRALDGVEIRLGQKDILGLIGPNGAGKTTLINVLTGYQSPTVGTMQLREEATTAWPPDRLSRAGLARTFQDVRLFPGLSAFENTAVAGLGIGLSSSEAGHQAIELLTWLGVNSRAHDLAKALTHEEARLVGIARALALRPAFLMLDEPAAGMSADESDHLSELLEAITAKFNCGLLIVEHNMRLVMGLCRRIQVLDYGKTIAEGTPAAVRADPAVIEAYLGRDARRKDA